MRGTVTFHETGRPQLVFGKRCDADQLEHEVLVTEAELLINGRLARNVRVGNAIADGMLVRNGARFYVEVDNQTMTATQMREKWMRYGDEVDGYILVICRTKERLRRLMRGAGLVKSVALFTRFRWLRSTRINEPWIDWYGKRVRI